MNERSTLGIFTSQHTFEPDSRRVFRSTGVAGRQGMAEPGSSCPAFVFYLCTSHISCSHLIPPLLLSLFPGWEMMLLPSPLALVGEEEAGRHGMRERDRI